MEKKEKSNLSERFLEFAVDIIKFLKNVPRSIENDVVKYQLTKSSSSIGANYEESQAASSKADFYNKIKISLKESRETTYWLRILKELQLGDQDQLDVIIKESKEIRNILGSISSSQRFYHK
jgi:four helix bundle protein